MHNLYHVDIREEFDKSVDLGRAGAQRETPHKEDLKCTGCGGMYRVTLLRNSIDAEPLEDVYDLSFRDDRYFGDYANVWFGADTMLGRQKDDGARLLKHLAEHPIRSFAKYDDDQRAEMSSDGKLRKHMECHHPQKLVRLEKVAAFANACKDVVEFKMAYNEAMRLIYGKDTDQAKYKHPGCDPDLLKIE